MAKCRITFECDKASAKTIVQLVLDRVSNLSMVDLGEPATNSKHPRSTNWLEKYKGPVLAYFKQKGGEISYQDHGLLAVVQKAGLKETSVSPLISDLCRAGLLQKCRRGVYRLPQ